MQKGQKTTFLGFNISIREQNKCEEVILQKLNILTKF